MKTKNKIDIKKIYMLYGRKNYREPICDNNKMINYKELEQRIRKLAKLVNYREEEDYETSNNSQTQKESLENL